MIDVDKFFHCIGDGSEKPEYDLIMKELQQIRAINNGFFSTYQQKENALARLGQLTAGLFNRAAVLDGVDIDQWD